MDYLSDVRCLVNDLRAHLPTSLSSSLKREPCCELLTLFELPVVQIYAAVDDDNGNDDHSSNNSNLQRPRVGLDGFWQRQFFIHSYKFTRRRTATERIRILVKKTKTAWAIARGLYKSQIKTMRYKLKIISDYVKFYRCTLHLLLSRLEPDNYLYMPL